MIAKTPYTKVFSPDYRYAYNGMEVDNEIKNNGNSYTTEFRQYDPRLGRWLSLDPLKDIQSFHSPYQAFNNNPIYFTDPSGLIGGGPETGDPELDELLTVIAEIGDTDKLTWAISEGGSLLTNDGSGTVQNVAEVTVVAKRRTPVQEEKSAEPGFIDGVIDFISNLDFVADASGEIKVGAAVGMKMKSGLINIEGEAALVNFTLVEGNVDITEIGSDDFDEYWNFQYIGDGNGVKVSQEIRGRATIAGFGIEGTAYNEFRTHGYGSFDEESDVVVKGVTPFSKPKKHKGSRQTNFGPKIKKPSKPTSAKVQVDREFFGLDFGAGAQLIIGVDVNLKLGFYY